MQRELSSSLAVLFAAVMLVHPVLAADPVAIAAPDVAEIGGDTDAGPDAGPDAGTDAGADAGAGAGTGTGAGTGAGTGTGTGADAGAGADAGTDADADADADAGTGTDAGTGADAVPALTPEQLEMARAFVAQKLTELGRSADDAASAAGRLTPEDLAVLQDNPRMMQEADAAVVLTIVAAVALIAALVAVAASGSGFVMIGG